MNFKAPMVYFGGKSKIASTVWEYLGDVPNYVEPFFGSGAVLLCRPNWSTDVSWIETVNDKDGYVSNFWRALQSDPDGVAHYADWPVIESDMHARHAWLVGQRESLVARLEGDLDYYDVKIAGWWVWGINCWIGSGWCSGNGPWQVAEDEQGIRQLVHLGNAGHGVNRKLVHLGNAGRGVNRKRVHLMSSKGTIRKTVYRGNGHNAGTGECGLLAWMQALAARLRRVRVCSGDWMRIMGESVTTSRGLTGVFLDPPYSADANRQEDLYSQDSLSVAHEVREWCIANGDNPLYRIVLCGYQGEHEALAGHGWRVHSWIGHAGYQNQNSNGNGNRAKEVLWISPHCLHLNGSVQLSLFS
jgi:hypothetical protein